MEKDGLSLEGGLRKQVLETGWWPSRNDRTKELYIQHAILVGPL